MKAGTLSFALAAALGLASFAIAPVAAAANGDNAMSCHMTFTLSGWSIIYHTADGKGVVTCADGQSMPVKIDAKGGGLTVGAYKITDGDGKFSHVRNIRNVLGTYAMATAHAGVVNSAHATVMTKGPVSLALTGQGQGWDIGAGFAGFTISEAK